MRLALDSNQCAGHGMCEFLAPGVFELDDSGRGRVIAPEPAADEMDAAEDAVAQCPMGAIRFEAADAAD